MPLLCDHPIPTKQTYQGLKWYNKELSLVIPSFTIMLLGIFRIEIKSDYQYVSISHSIFNQENIMTSKQIYQSSYRPESLSFFLLTLMISADLPWQHNPKLLVGS